MSLSLRHPLFPSSTHAHAGNMTVVPIVRAIGLAQGLLVWGTMNMIMGWAAAR
jgi:hypothetical protein